MRHLILLLFSLTSTLSFSQKARICINEKYYTNNSECDYAPHLISYRFRNAQTNIVQGHFLLIRHRRIIEKVVIDTSNTYEKVLDSLQYHIKSGDKLLLEYQKISLGKSTTNLNGFSIIRFKSLLPEPDPSLELLINGSVEYKQKGIYINENHKFEFISRNKVYSLDTLTAIITLARGYRPITRSMKSLKKFDNGLFLNTTKGDRYIIEVYCTSDIKTIEINGLFPDKRPIKVIIIPLEQHK